MDSDRHHNRLNALPYAVTAMRQAQKAYFKSRSHGDLVKAKEAEKQVDKLVLLLTDPRATEDDDGNVVMLERQELFS